MIFSADMFVVLFVGFPVLDQKDEGPRPESDLAPELQAICGVSNVYHSVVDSFETSGMKLSYVFVFTLAFKTSLLLDALGLSKAW